MDNNLDKEKVDLSQEQQGLWHRAVKGFQESAKSDSTLTWMLVLSTVLRQIFL